MVDSIVVLVGRNMVIGRFVAGRNNWIMQDLSILYRLDLMLSHGSRAPLNMGSAFGVHCRLLSAVFGS